MTYTPNVPQANQQISTTQPIINANFQFLPVAIGQEHNFNASSATSTYHLACSMPSKALSPSLPAGCNGQYFVNVSNPFFYDGTTNWQMNTWEGILTGVFTPTSGYTNIVAVPANKQGIIIFENKTIPAAQVGTFVTDGSKCFAFSTRMKLNGTNDDYPIELNNSSATLNMQGQRFSSTYQQAFSFKLFFRPA